MNIDLVIALALPWIFWGIVMGLLILARRSWVNMLLFPVGTTVVLLMIANVASYRDAFWGSAIMHLLLLVYAVGSYISFVIKERKNKQQ